MGSPCPTEMGDPRFPGLYPHNSTPKMPNLQQQKELAGPLVERTARRVIVAVKQVLMAPYWILTLPFRQLRGEIMSLRAAAVESIAYVGVELRRLGDLLEQSEAPKPAAVAPAEVLQNGTATAIVEAPFVFRSLASLQAPAPVLIVGPQGRDVGVSLASLGYEVSLLDPGGSVSEHPKLELVRERLADWDAGGRRFEAILSIGDPAVPGAEGIERIGELLAPKGILVITVPFGFSRGPGDGRGYDEAALTELLSDWKVAEQTVVASRAEDDWAPVQNGASAERGVALVAARPATPSS
jgi:hypothetical protein